jgi:hypothetical protein
MRISASWPPSRLFVKSGLTVALVVVTRSLLDPERVRLDVDRRTARARPCRQTAATARHGRGRRGYDYDNDRRAVRERGVCPRIARKQTAHGSGLGRQRWVLERTLSWLHQHRRLRIRWERRADIHEAFLSLACSLICFRRLQASLC